ncbi:MAG: glycosyl hydrolase [Acidobacteria bacterium]|nr:glycosyl hydrolase [Acidobacteriota bacterium]
MLLASVAAQPAPTQQYDKELLRGMEWRLIGPFRGGRVLAVTGVAGNPNVFYFGSVAGGVWKTTDAGTTWEPIFDHEATASIGSIAVSRSDPKVIFVGTGEACYRGDISFGEGVYKSTDAGATWTNVGLKDSEHIAQVIVDPKNANRVFVAAVGHAHGPNPERGIFRTLDGGKTWQKVLFKDDRTGAIDVTFDPNNSNILFAALWEGYRSPYSLVSGGPGSGLYRSIDGGTTWKRLEGNGLPAGVFGRIGVAVGADSRRVYAQIEAEQGGLFRSDDGGSTWARVNADRSLQQRAFYYSHVFADPKSASTVYVLNVDMYRSTDGGKTFTELTAPHGDYHALWIDPSDPQRMINGNDGGATITVNGGKTWTAQDNQPTAQFYHVAVDNRYPYYVYGAQQDNSTVAIASRSDHGAIDRMHWYPVGGGESGYIVPDPRDANIVYAGSYGGNITRYDKRTEQIQKISAWPENPMGSAAEVLKHRFQWTSPIAVSPHDPSVIYHGAELLFKTTDGGMSWTPISPDLTRNDRSKQQPSGGPITLDNNSSEYYDTIFTVAESPVQKDLIWVGTDDGLIQITKDGGKQWVNVTPKQMPEWSLISLIDPSPFDAGTAYVAVDRHRLDDLRPYVYKTSDFGATWTRINEGIAPRAYVHAVREDPKRKGLLYAGTETGVFVSFDAGAHWQSLQLNLPTAPVHDLVVKDNDLVVATHGRAFWILDDLSPIRQLNAEVAAADVHLFEPSSAIRARTGRGQRGSAPVGANPPAGAVLYYTLKAAPAQPITLDILDTGGRVIRTYTSAQQPAPPSPSLSVPTRPPVALPAKPGLNRFAWDLHVQDPTGVPGAVHWGGGPGGRGPRGPFVAPGRYQAKLTVAGKSVTAPIEVTLDPRVRASKEDVQKQFDLATKIAARVSQAHEAVNEMRVVKAELDAAIAREVPRALVEAARQVQAKLVPVEDAILQGKAQANEDIENFPIRLNDKLIDVQGAVESADTAPTAPSYEVFEYLGQQLDSELAKWNEIKKNELAKFRSLLRKPTTSPESSRPRPER